MRRGVAVLGAAAVLLTGCASGDDAVVQGGGSFNFVSPGGQSVITYDEGERGAVGDLRGPDLLDQTQTVALDAFDGDVVVINLWGQWCGPCRTETDDLEAVYTATRASGVEFLGINVKDPDISKPQDFVRDNGVSYPSIWDPSYRSLIAFGGNFPSSTTPATFVLDREHRVAVVFLTAVTAEQLQPVVERVAAEQPAPS